MGLRVPEQAILRHVPCGTYKEVTELRRLTSTLVTTAHCHPEGRKNGATFAWGLYRVHMSAKICVTDRVTMRSGILEKQTRLVSAM